ncbi:MAG TPA: GTPase HflX [Nitrolancea sp.]|nr:GTPase HflX [Nitrolancea sp.]
MNLKQPRSSASNDRSSIDRGEHPITNSINVIPERERAVLVAVDWQHNGWDLPSSLEELARLAETAGIDVVDSVTQHLAHPNRTHYVGSGKLQEIVALGEQVQFDLVLVNDELSPAQLRNMEEALQKKVIDRTALILDIFAARAQTHEGRLQVELAQLDYRLPRLTRMWSHLSRQAVGGVGLRGPGETQLEVDRREARRRISWLKQQLEEVHRHRQQYRDRRTRAGMPVIGLVGYTNAGKSTLLNALSGADVLVEDKLFATLDPTTRRIALPTGREVLVTDTVGFIHNLPTFLVAAFRATLEEIREASALIHVLDLTHPRVVEQAATVQTVLEELGADGVPTIAALNKIDQIEDATTEEALRERLTSARAIIPISAHTGAGLDELLVAVSDVLSGGRRYVDVNLLVPFGDARMLDLFHRVGQVKDQSFSENGTEVSGRLPERLLPQFSQYLRGKS